MKQNNNEEIENEEIENEEIENEDVKIKKSKHRNKRKRNFNIMSGYVVLPSGAHSIPINVCHAPREVILEIITPEDGCQVCGNISNSVGFAVIRQGFVIFAEIKSNYATIEWTIRY